jgi:hypothetical protein
MLLVNAVMAEIFEMGEISKDLISTAHHLKLSAAPGNADG